jgi:hypothetical protein
MIPYGLFSQIFLLIISGALVITYVKPTLTDIGLTQDRVSVYKEEIEKVAAVNLKLNNLASSQAEVRASDRENLRAYIPDSVDTIQVARDLSAITAEAGVILRNVEYVGSTKEEGTDATSDQLLFDPTAVGAPTQVLVPEGHRFTMDFEGSYAQIKNVFSLFDENHYPLEVHSLDIIRNEGGFLSAEVDIITYDSFLPSVPDSQIQ